MRPRLRVRPREAHRGRGCAGGHNRQRAFPSSSGRHWQPFGLIRQPAALSERALHFRSAFEARNAAPISFLHRATSRPWAPFSATFGPVNSIPRAPWRGRSPGRLCPPARDVPPASRNAKSRFFPHFVRFQGFARRKISLSVATPTRLPRDRRSATAGNEDVSHRLETRRFPASPHASGRGARTVGRDLNAVVVGHAPAPRPARGIEFDPKTVPRIRFLRKRFLNLPYEWRFRGWRNPVR